MHRFLAVICSMLLVAANPAAESKTGLAVGEKAPSFALKDQTGQERALEELLQKGKVALVFHRSAGW